VKRLAVAAGVLLMLFSWLAGCKQSMLNRGVEKGKPGMVSLALRLGADKEKRNDDGMTPLMIAAQGGYAEPVKKLIAAKVDLNARQPSTGMTALMFAARNGHAEVVDALGAAKAAIDLRDNDGMTAYTHAFRENHFEVAHKVQYIAENNVPLPDRDAEQKGMPRTAKRIVAPARPLLEPAQTPIR
jgi:ankyrin repeat protein